VHTVFKIFALAILMPCSRLLERLAVLTVPDGKDEAEKKQLLDDRLLGTPTVAIERARKVAVDMALLSVDTLRRAISLLSSYSDKEAIGIAEGEDRVDKYEDALGTYLVKISACPLTEQDSHEVTKLLHIIGDFERISDHAVNISESAQEMFDKKLEFSENAKNELSVMISAVDEILDSALKAFCDEDLDVAFRVEPLEEVIDTLNSRLKKRHVARLQKGECTIELGFVLSDLLTNLERVSDHCSNIAGCVIEIEHDTLDMHEYMEKLKSEGNPRYTSCYEAYRAKYILPAKG
jgi:Na/Pi-cotransporter II-like protein